MNFWDFFWTLIVFYFWFMLIWIFIRIWIDLFRRQDLTGARKVVWMLGLLFLPFLGSLIYMLVRKPTEQEIEQATQAEVMQKRASGYSPAEEVAKLQQLKDSGALTQEEFDTAKAKALA
jgi:Short C-terminal domain/Phospholipase_D-nuclease N-terminal